MKTSHGTIYTVEDLKRIATQQGSHYFSKNTLRFFRARPNRVYDGPGGMYYVETQSWFGGPRFGVVKLITLNGDGKVHFGPTIAGIDDGLSLKAAQGRAKRCAESPEVAAYYVGGEP